MKRKQKPMELHVFLGDGHHQCSKCLHSRKNEPFVEFVWYRSSGASKLETRCWRCCHDAESTFMIWQNWPIAFDRVQVGQRWDLHWNQVVQLLRGNLDEA